MNSDTVLVQVWLESPDRNVRTLRTPGMERVLVHRADVHEMSMLLLRSPAANPPVRVPKAARVDEHVAAGPDETADAWLSCADVIVRRVTGTAPVSSHLSRVHARYPGCLVAALIHPHHGGVVSGASGWRAWLVPLKAGTLAEDDVSLCASVVHAWTTTGRSLTALRDTCLTIERGQAARRSRVRVIVEDRDFDRRTQEEFRRSGS